MKSIDGHAKVVRVVVLQDGHSMGSFAAQRLCLDHSGDMDAVILSGSSSLDVLAANMASAAEELMAKPALGVTDVRKDTTVLIDDDPKNIRKSLKDGTRAVWFNPRDPKRLLAACQALQWKLGRSPVGRTSTLGEEKRGSVMARRMKKRRA